MMGLTPIAGVNDDGTDFSISNAQSLESFAASNGVQELSFWEVDGYDKGTGYQYSSIFNQITGGGGGHSASQPGAPGRSPGTRACAWTTARPAPPTSTRSRSTPATGPTRRAGP